MMRVALDISNPSAPAQVGRYKEADGTIAVAVSGSYAYLADDWFGLRVIDISNPVNPIQVGFYSITTCCVEEGIAVSDPYIYLAKGEAGLHIYRFMSLGIEGRSNPSPSSFLLYQNYLNPFGFTTTIRYQLPTETDVSLKVYSCIGQLVRTLVSRRQSAGYYETTWDGRDKSNEEVTNGIYFYKLQTRDHTQTKKMVLLR